MIKGAAIATLLASALMSGMQAEPALAGASVQEYGAALVQYFNSLNAGYEPFITAEGQQVGDVIDVRDRSVLKRRSVCFPSLVPPQPDKFDLPRYVGISESAASFFFELKKLFGLAASGKLVDNISLVFTDATIEDITLDDLQSNLSKECEFLKPLIADAQPIKLYGRTATLIRTVIRAKATTVMSFGTDLSANAKVETLKGLLPGGAASVLPVDASIEAKIGLKGQKAVTLQTEGSAAVAFRPTHIPKRLLGAEPAEGLIPFDPTNKVQIQIQEKAADAWARSLQ
ncbi:hypothetical protein ABIB80_004394 [Bradyrhizobium sp. i1.15.2]|uniref:hypothetical protein n=1 Tax=Bradyrhizobium sp. i1.15.2 TaxID=3156362 RepID=UPI00339884E1